MIHDLFLYDWHTHAAQTGERFHGLKHPEKAYRNAKKYFPLNQIEVDIIRTHMWPVTFRTFGLRPLLTSIAVFWRQDVESRGVMP